VVTIGGMAPVTFGAYRTTRAAGHGDITRCRSNAITVLSGSMGSMRIGTG